MRLTPLVSGCIVTVLGFYAVFSGVTPQPSIVTFDKEAVQGQFIRQLAEIKATEHQIEQSTRRFKEALNKVLVNQALQKKAIILRKQEVLAGGRDITDEVRIKVNKAMRNKS
jgi:type-F conjugative transfer system protein TrbI